MYQICRAIQSERVQEVVSLLLWVARVGFTLTSASPSPSKGKDIQCYAVANRLISKQYTPLTSWSKVRQTYKPEYI